ncbi:ATPase_AAA_core domain-containing protein [Haematococcus lacustris]|uniref:ATPase_AAA_core domain-containing protein n=1 Tax=Haematococcus lacustris TaxID=44745 RepID=A0A699YZT1_HAELA|nr:ATPase_AAA_core domain-containing protein [Haematococcus lacustris]
MALLSQRLVRKASLPTFESVKLQLEDLVREGERLEMEQQQVLNHKLSQDGQASRTTCRYSRDTHVGGEGRREGDRGSEVAAVLSGKMFGMVAVSAMTRATSNVIFHQYQRISEVKHVVRLHLTHQPTGQ